MGMCWTRKASCHQSRVQQVCASVASAWAGAEKTTGWRQAEQLNRGTRWVLRCDGVDGFEGTAQQCYQGRHGVQAAGTAVMCDRCGCTHALLGGQRRSDACAQGWDQGVEQGSGDKAEGTGRRQVGQATEHGPKSGLRGAAGGDLGLTRWQLGIMRPEGKGQGIRVQGV